MTHAVTLTREIRPTRMVDGLEGEVFASEVQAHIPCNAVSSFIEQQVAACVAHTATIACAWERVVWHSARTKGAPEMAHTIRYRPAPGTRRSRLELRLWLALHAQVCECCGLALWGRRYTNAALQRVCRSCFLTGLPAPVVEADRPQEG
jgi:hypothetical protein